MKGIIIGLPLQENSIVLCDKVVVQDRSIMVRFSHGLLERVISKRKHLRKVMHDGSANLIRLRFLVFS